ncbi:MAG TPA: hypothetical protein VFU58_02370 [Candidatus Nitrosotalea sp.]|nr:hypothetical protein [Candidatus Nitrosotalea sp.]
MFSDNLGTSNMDPPTIPHMIKHGRKARNTGTKTANARLCKVNVKYVTPINARNDATNNTIFFLLFILELHDIIVFSYLVVSIV